MFTVRNMTLSEYLARHNCDLVRRGIFFHFKEKGREHSIEIAYTLYSEPLDRPIGELSKGEFIICFEDKPYYPKCAKQKIKSLRRTLKRYLPEERIL